ncbi:hypothetical protein EON78_06455 [bacterium]|nr:MAG: hypothetical protein EON78_06455 [bacterium]
MIDGKVYRQDFCIVENYKRNAMNEKMIDSMANALYKIYKPKYFSYQLAVYKYSDYTNPTHLTEYPRDLDRYSQDNDMIFTYRWLGNSPVNKWIWRKGEVISPKIDIIIEDAPPLPKQYLGISYGISQFPLCKRDRKIS